MCGCENEVQKERERNNIVTDGKDKEEGSIVGFGEERSPYALEGEKILVKRVGESGRE